MGLGSVSLTCEAALPQQPMAGSALGLSSCRGLQASKRRDFPVARPAPGRRRRGERQQGGGVGVGVGGKLKKEGPGEGRGKERGALAPLARSVSQSVSPPRRLKSLKRC